MNLLFHIPNAMLNSIWLMSILYLVYIAFKYVFKLNPAKKFFLVVAAELLATIYFIISIVNPSHNSNKLTYINIGTNSVWSVWVPYIGILYCIALLTYLTYLIIEFKQLSFLKQSADFENNNFWNQELKKIGLNGFQIGQSNKIKSPITFGWIDAVILLPFSILNHLSLEEVKFIVLHEVAHIVRNDFMIQLVMKFCHTILLFNPFSYFFTKEINLQRELACDEWVVKHFSNPLTYSKSLYQLAMVTNAEQSPLLLNAIGGQNDLLNRIKHIHQVPVHTKLPFKQLTLACCLFIVTSIGIYIPTAYNNQVVSTKTKKQVSTYYYARLVNDQNKRLNKKVPILVIKKLKAPLPPPTPFKEEEYKAVVSNAVNWIKTREDQYQMVNYSKTRDSLEFEITEKLLLRSLLQNYQLRKELLNAKLATIESEKEALDYLDNSKEWQEVLQYENWASTFFKRHPELSRTDSLRRF